MVTGKTRIIKDGLIRYYTKLGRKLKHTDSLVTRSVQKGVNMAQGELPKSEANTSLRLAIGKPIDSRAVKHISKALQEGASDIIRDA